MDQLICELPAEVADALDLGQVLGQNQTFGMIAGHCSAAQAVTLRRLHDAEKFKLLTPRWRDFCAQYLKISGAEADRILHCLEEFGPRYFELTQLVRISPETYRAIAPALREGALEMSGDAIDLTAENSGKLAAAVAELRRTIPKKPKKRPRPLAMHERIAALDTQWTAVIAEFREISRLERSGENWLQFTSILSRALTELRRVGLENDIT